MPLPTHMQRCHGLRDAYSDTVRPLPMCCDCDRWRDAADRPAGATVLPFAPAEVRLGVLICPARLRSADAEG